MTPRTNLTAAAPAAPATAALSRLGTGWALPPPNDTVRGSPSLHADPAVGAAAALTWQALLGGARSGGDGLAAGDTLSDDELLALHSLARLRLVAAGQPVLQCGSPATTLVALHSGEVALGLRRADAVMRTERILRGPAWLDLSAAWLRQPHAVDVQALSAVSVLDLPCGALRGRLPRWPGLAQRLLTALALELRALVLNTQELMHKDAPARLAQWLHARSLPLPLPGADPQPDRPSALALVRLHERKRDVASQLAITPETLSRLMRSFSQAGVIEVCGYDVRVLDPAALARLAQG